MSMDLIISDTGDVMIASNEDFPAEVTRVDFLTSRKLLMINYAAHGPEAELLNLEVHDRLMSALLKAPSLLLVRVKNNAPVAGFEVPIVQIGFAPEDSFRA